jgi:hypothetical protein
MRVIAALPSVGLAVGLASLGLIACSGVKSALDADLGGSGPDASDAIDASGMIDASRTGIPDASFQETDVFVPTMDAPPLPVDVPPTQPDAAQPDAGDLVTGTYIDRYTDNMGTHDAPQDLEHIVSALVPDGNGGFRTIIGTGHPDGTFEIANVPHTLFYARVGGYTVVTSERVLDLGIDITARRGQLFAQSPDTKLSFDISGLGSSMDYIMFSSVNEPDVALKDENYGGTTGHFVDTISWQNLPLVDATAGDTLDVLDLTRATGGANPSLMYVHLGNRFVADPFTMFDGQTTMITGAFTPETQDRTSTVDWRRSQFDALKTSVNPAAENVFPHFFQIAAGPPAFPDHAVAYLALFAFQFDTGITDENYGTVTYADPYPASWPVYNYAESDFKVSYTAAGATNPLKLTAQVIASTNVDANPVPIVPVVGPVTAPKVAGMDAFQPQSGVGLSPVISWTAPAVGTASGYTIYVCELDASGADSSYVCVAEYVTEAGQTSFQVLPNQLETGKTYFAIITAHYLPNLGFAQHPFRFSLPWGKADVYTATFTP